MSTRWKWANEENLWEDVSFDANIGSDWIMRMQANKNRVVSMETVRFDGREATSAVQVIFGVFFLLFLFVGKQPTCH